MALMARQKRCALCGSSEVTATRRGTYRCSTCGGESTQLMCAGDRMRIDRIRLMGGSEKEIALLRRRYPRLGIATWSASGRLDIR